MSDKVFVGRKAATLSVPPAFDPISKIIILVDSENVYEAGDETGLTLEFTCPYGTQTLADNLLALHKGFTYQPLEAGDALMDPSAELGDGVTIAGAYTMLAEQELEFDSHLASTVKAPGQQELESEYPFQTKEQQLERKIARTRSMISKTAEQIYLEVAKKVGEDEANTLISAAIGKIELSVSSKNGSTSFTLTDGEAEISAQTLNLTVPAVNITGKLKASQIDAEELHVNAANIDGTLKASQIQLSGAITFGDLDDDLQDTINSAGGLDENEVTTLITESLVQSPTIMGGEFYDIDEVGRLTLSYDGRAWMTFAGIDSGREMFSVGGTDYGNSADVTLMTFADETILQKTGYGETYLTNNVNIELPLSTALESADIVDKLKSVLGLS